MGGRQEKARVYEKMGTKLSVQQEKFERRNAAATVNSARVCLRSGTVLA